MPPELSHSRCRSPNASRPFASAGPPSGHDLPADVRRDEGRATRRARTLRGAIVLRGANTYRSRSVIPRAPATVDGKAAAAAEDRAAAVAADGRDEEDSDQSRTEPGGIDVPPASPCC